MVLFFSIVRCVLKSICSLPSLPLVAHAVAQCWRLLQVEFRVHALSAFYVFP